MSPDQREASRLSCRQWRLWEKRADTIHRNAEALFSDIMQKLGEEASSSDVADDLMEAAAGMARAMAWMANRSKSEGRRA